MPQRISDARLQAWAGTLIGDEEALQAVKDRFHMRMLERFRSANAEQRDIINAIMDNSDAFFEELQAIVDDIEDINDTTTEETEDTRL